MKIFLFFYLRFKIKNCFNPVLQHYYQCISQRAIDEKTEVPEIDPVILEYLCPEKKMKCKEELDNFKKLFNLKEQDIKKEKGKVFWRKIIENQQKESLGIFFAKNS